ncbi:hypothetical protein J2M53_16530 [Arthrobacter sp. zg-ZUI100]|uniref:hypothetical protein n=1 Tax=Arthrobacter jiangjiafuii TaxID=2817475 RepID=UPI001AEDC73D|nr:hypothetical protein [Arthrobacter jiangjiafuii]MBP3037846.1 hypothetical protein [Arthrobacter jiangjiafuii]
MDTSGSAPRERWNEHVQIREVGAADHGPDRLLEEDDVATGPAASRPKLNKSFRAAWVLSALMIGIGLLWIGGAFEAATQTSYSGSNYSPTGEYLGPDLPPLTTQLRNLGYIAQSLLTVGLTSATALLIVQGVLRSRAAAAVDR